MTRMRPLYRVSRKITQVLFWLGLRGRVFGTHHVPRTGGVLLLCNHQSFFDPMLATLALPRECSYMARDTLFENPRFRKIIEAYNAFPIKRGTADLRGIKEALRRLRGGWLVTTFPEGTRSVDGSIGEMHPGSVLLARKAGVPIVPAAIIGAYKAWPRHARRPRPVPVVVAYGEPLWPEQMAELSDEAAIAIVRDRIVALYRRYEGHPALRR